MWPGRRRLYKDGGASGNLGSGERDAAAIERILHSPYSLYFLYVDVFSAAYWWRWQLWESGE